MRKIVFVCRQAGGESLRCAEAVGKLDGVSVGVVCTEDVEELIAAARQAHADLIVTAQETLLEAVAEANEALGLEAMSVTTVRRALDKPSLKRALAGAGIDTARHRVVVSDGDARHFAHAAGFPIVLKPMSGSGGLATWRIRDARQLEVALELLRPSMENAVLAEEYLEGEELCIDTITVANEPRLHSICCYRPSILAALEDPAIQWRCVMPRDMSAYGDFIEKGLAAVRALSVGNAMTHMEGFILPNGEIRFTDATLRPAGARIGAMLAHAYDVDPYLAWARVAVDGEFDGPWERKYAVGTIFLRGLGTGVVAGIAGVPANELIVEARFPRAGAAKSATYTGDGYITVRHRETDAVEEALDRIAASVRIVYSDTALDAPLEEQWRDRLQYSERQLYRPAWDADVGSGRIV